MTFAVACHDCEETVYPPHEAEGTGGRSEIAALRLALEHATETGHQDVHVIPGSYWVGDDPRPEGFGDGDVDPDDYVTPPAGQLATTLDFIRRSLRQRADRYEDLVETLVDDKDAHDCMRSHCRDLRQLADIVENNLEHALERDTDA